jgi:PAS domain S-box-containing protein
MRKFKRRFTDFSLNSKLAILIGIFLISFIILGAFVDLLFSTSKTSTIVVNVQREFIVNFNNGIGHFYRYELTGNTQELDESRVHLNKAIGIAYTFATIDSIIGEMPRKEWQNHLYSHFREGVNYEKRKVRLLGNMMIMLSVADPAILNDIQAVARKASLTGKEASLLIDQYVQNKNPELLSSIEASFESIHSLTETFSQQIYSFSNYIFRRLFLYIILFVLILGTVVTLVSKGIANSISRPINKLIASFKKIAKGDLQSTVKIDTKNEVGELSNAFMEIQVGLQDIIAYSKKVAEGDYSQKLIPKSENDELTVALNKMAERLEETKSKTEKESWLQNGISGLEDQMRGNYSVRELSSRIINYLCSFLKVEMGAVYVYDEVLEHLEFTGSLGINRQEVKEVLNLGEGLIGTAALNTGLQVLDTNGRYHKVFSASGELFPEKLYLLPLHYNKHIQAVIELATIRELTNEKLDFLKAIADSISVNLGASVARYRHKELLDQSLQQAEVLKARDEELSLKLGENRQIQEKLVQEKALLDSMLKIIPDFIHFKDLECKFMRISKSLAGFLNVPSASDLIGKSDFDLYPRNEAKIYFEEEQKLITEGKGFIDKINKNTDENGNNFWTSVTKLPMYDETGKCIGTFGISKDITQVKKLEIEVQQHNDKLITQQEELKTTNEELKSQEEELRVANEELAEQTKVLTESQKNLQAQQEELHVINEELEVKSVELERQKKEITIKNDNLIKTQNELRKKARELEQASIYKSEFLANMSHELRTPLNSLLILSKLMANNKKGNLTEDQLKSIQIIHKSGKDLLDLINEILDLSKIEAGKMTYEFTDVSTEEMLTEILHTFKPVAENKNLELLLNRSDNFPKKIFTDRQRLMQVIKNLLSNAFKFTSSGGIKVNFGMPAEGTLFVNAELNISNTCYISVEDSGVGIPKGKAEAIFEAFQQADGSISRKFGGTGLGLSISKQLIQVLGGEIHVESTEGVGSVFTVYLPVDKTLAVRDINAAAEKVTSQPADLLEAESISDSFAPEEIRSGAITSQKKAPQENLLVLIIHDLQQKVQQLVSLCHKKKINTITAISVDEGIKLAEKQSPGAIIVSAALSQADFEELRKNQNTCQLPLHLISRIDETLNETIDELLTPESEVFKTTAKTIENKLKKDYKQVLVVEDDQNTRIAIQSLFENKEIDIHEAKTGQQAFDMIVANSFDCIILDLGLPDFSGNQLLKKLNEAEISIPNLVIHTARDLSQGELRELQEYSESIVIKGIKSDERLMDEVTLFLHQVENKTPKTELKNNNGKSVFKGKKVLVVDDDIRNVFALVQILEEREIEVLEAENGEVAIEVLQNNPDIDLVLMDIMMPVMDGYEAMTRIRNTELIKNIPIITLTAKAMKEDYRKAIDCGANDYISKPVDLDKLVSLLKIWLFK